MMSVLLVALLATSINAVELVTTELNDGYMQTNNDNSIANQVILDCNKCQFVLRSVASLHMDSNGTLESNVVDALQDVCEEVAVWKRPSCLLLIDEITPGVIGVMKNSLSPLDICIAIELCEWDAHSGEANDETECDTCHLILASVLAYAEGEIFTSDTTDALAQLCKHHSRLYKNVCGDMMERLTPAIISLLRGFVEADKGCISIEMCPEETDDSKHMEKMYGNPLTNEFSPECDMCQTVMGSVTALQIATNASIEASVVGALHDVCDEVSVWKRPSCSLLINQITPAVIDVVKMSLNNQNICIAIALCEAEEGRADANSDTECETCHIILDSVLSYTQGGLFVNDTTDALAQICKHHRKLYTNVCGDMMDRLAPAIIAHIQGYVESQPECIAIEMCPAEINNQLKFEQNEGATTNHVNPDLTPQCSLCTFVLKRVKDYVSDKTTEEELESLLETICSFMPGGMHDECLSMIETYLPQIFALIGSEIDPQTTCEDLLLCESTPSFDKVNQDPIECQLCDKAVSSITAILTDTSTQSEVQTALESLCSDMPFFVRPTCTRLIDVIAPLLFSEIDKEVASVDICADLGLCIRDPLRTKFEKPNISIMEMPNAVPCDLCNFIVTTAVGEVGSDPTEEALTKALHGVCDVMEVYKDRCNSEIEKYAHEIFNLLKTTTPDRICIEIGFCHKRINLYFGHKFSTRMVKSE